MKKIMTAVALAAFMTAPGVAQNNSGAACCQGDRCDVADTLRCEKKVVTGECVLKSSCPADCFEGITLTDEQRKEINGIDAKRAESCRKAESKMQSERKKAAMEYDKALKKILTPEQYAAYRKNVSNSQPQRDFRVNKEKISGRGLRTE